MVNMITLIGPQCMHAAAFKVILNNFNASERLGEGKSSLGIVARTRKVVP